MTRARSITYLLMTAVLVAFASPLYPAPQAKEADFKGCKDHPLFTRMANMRITTCESTSSTGSSSRPAKGRRCLSRDGDFVTKYQTIAGDMPPSALAIIRNHQQAIAGSAGPSSSRTTRYTVVKVSKDGKETWAQVDTAWQSGYLLTIVEKQAMVQDVVASAELFQAGLKTSGHVEVPGIYFDTGKAELKPESDAAVAEIARLLKADPALKVYVVGHTDNVASLDLNTKLSQARAEAVVQALAARHGIAAARLIGRGVGPLAPVASNDSDEGRARNRRVELVKQ